MKYLVTKEIKSETQVFWIFYLQDFLFLALWAMICMIAKEQVHDTLRIPYGIFSAAAGIGLMLPGTGNPKRRVYQSLVLYLLRPRCIFRYFKEQEHEEKRSGTHSKRNSHYRVR